MLDIAKLISEISIAREAIKGVAQVTPLEYSETFSRLTCAKVYFKMENLQKTGSFKIRGASYKIQTLTDEEKARGVVAASAGNHAQGVAHAAHMAGVKATVVMPEGAPVSKVEATKQYGADIILHGANYDEAYCHALKIQQERQAVFVHAFDDPAIIAGQGTMAAEILEALPDMEAIIIPIGGGGLISGMATYIKHHRPEVKIIGVQTEGVPSMYLSRKEGKITTLNSGTSIADGINVKKPGEYTFPLVQKFVDEIVTVDDEAIAATILMLLERAKIVAEGSGAVSLAALLSGKISLASKKTAVVISGGNIDFNIISQLIERGLVKTGRLVSIRTVLEDRPSALQGLLQIIANTGANVFGIHHNRLKPNIPLRQAEVIINLETRNHEHVTEIMTQLVNCNYNAERI